MSFTDDPQNTDQISESAPPQGMPLPANNTF